MEGSGDEIEREVGEGLLMAGGRQIDMIIYIHGPLRKMRGMMFTQSGEREEGKGQERR